MWVRIDRSTYARGGWFLRRFPGQESWSVVGPSGAPEGAYPTLGRAKAVVDRKLGPPELTETQRRALVAVARPSPKTWPSGEMIEQLQRARLVESYRYYRPGFSHESTGVRLTTRGRTLVASLGDRKRRSR